jgi:cytochrome c-type biogenesis protein CcmH
MGDILFWGVALAMALAVAGLLVAALTRTRGAAKADHDLQVYRDQLKEVDRDLARGLIGEDEAARLRVEIGRRVLAADAAAQAGAATGDAGPGRAALAAIMTLAVLGVGGGVYLWQGAPGYGDLPLALRLQQAEDRRAARPDQAAAEEQARADLPPAPLSDDPRHLELLDRLRTVMKDRPNDLQGQELLARNEAMVGNYAAAAQAQAMVVALKGPAATAADLAMQAELMIMAAGGYVSPQAEAVLSAALDKDAGNGSARYYSGLMFLQTGRPDLAFRFWAPLLEGSSPDDPWVDALRAQLPDVAFMAGQHRYEMPALSAAPAPAPGPDAAALEAAQDMTPEQRDQMVRGMVDGLMDRLASQGGTATEWARLIRALGVLGERDRAKAIHAEAQARFAGRDADLAEIAAAAAEAGLQ